MSYKEFVVNMLKFWAQVFSRPIVVAATTAASTLWIVGYPLAGYYLLAEGVAVVIVTGYCLYWWLWSRAVHRWLYKK